MEIPLQITAMIFANPSTESDIRDKAAKLDTIYDRIIRCRVILEAPVGHHRHGGPFKVRIDVTVPGSELVVNRQEDDDLPISIRNAFDAMRRRLEDYVRQQRGNVKTHEAPLLNGHVTKLFLRKATAFSKPAMGEKCISIVTVYSNRFERLTIAPRCGSSRRGKRPQASTSISARINSETAPHNRRRIF
jgi:ribosome-associated translation inhibitor RaiA